ncbi:sigma 54-interacting transcriptional regulator [Brevibacillus choshinensis]|uniref:sigma 54-interacting transcriptional regulator n=1 Tax=Brevibacillus choshinensis TaxID=54911 RepID=UPI0006EC0A6A|nr:sigma 54-interacting transcriptional regulator [Brevibacillus choshinensis]
MEEHIKQIIDQEDKKVPYTDEQIARQMGIRRDEVTLLRHKLQIPDSRKRRQPLLLKEMESLLQPTPNMTSRELTSRLNERGYDVSRFMVHQLRSKMEAFSDTATPNKDDRARQKTRKVNQAVTFASLIGAKSTLKAAIQQAQAAVLYPPHGLHTLFFGATGVGKSRMAEAMYQFAVEQQVMKKNAPFVIFNCADYAKNPQLLLSQLFGYVKGAFTGAQQDKLGLVDQADGGILFLDEIHRLPPEGQENLFYLIDKGVYRRLGEVQFQQKATILIVGATTESPESSLLLTLRRRIPMTIELPSLSEWTQQERLSLIFHFLNEETDRIGREVVVQKEVIASLLTYECPANMGQLHSDIRVLLAKAFLKTIHQEEKTSVQVDRYDLPVHIASHQQSTGLAPELPMLKKNQFLFIPGQHSDLGGTEIVEDSPQHLYDWVVERYQNLRNQGQSEELIELIVNKELDTRMEPSTGEHEKRSLRLQQLVKLVGDQVVQAVEQMLWIAERHMTLDYQRISYALAIHLHGLLDRWPDTKEMDSMIETDHESMEFKVALEMAKVIQTSYGVELPVKEVSILAMYVKQCSIYTEPKPMIGVVVTSYGLVAKSMVDVATRLFERKHALAVELYWNDDQDVAVERICAMIQQVDQGEGVILLADMGSNLLSEQEWERRSGVRVQVLPNVTTTLVIEVMRKCLYSSESLEQIVNQMRHLPVKALHSVQSFAPKPVAIVTICITGKGAAKRLDQLLQEKLEATVEQVTILTASSLSIRKQYKEWLEKYHIFAVVGTVNPMLDGIPFISIKEIVDESGISFMKRLLLVANGTLQPSLVPRSHGLRDLLYPELVCENLEISTKEEVIECLALRLREHGFVESDFVNKVWEREKMGNTCLFGAAIPHADTTQTIRPGIAIANLAQPMEWEAGYFVSHVFMLAITETCQTAVEELYHFLHEHEEANEPPDLQAFMELEM